jgi:hypothetical protein
MFRALRGGVNPAPEGAWQADRFKVARDRAKLGRLGVLALPRTVAVA